LISIAEKVKYIEVSSYAVSLGAQTRHQRPRSHCQARPGQRGRTVSRARDIRSPLEGLTLEDFPEGGSFAAAFISAYDLMATKAASGRAQDIAEVEAVRKADTRAATTTKPQRHGPA
jgi:hypothetical protein